MQGTSSFSIRSNDAKELTKMFQSNQLESYCGPKDFLNDPQNSYWKKYDSESFANGWQRCRIKSLTENDPEMMEECAELGKFLNVIIKEVRKISLFTCICCRLLQSDRKSAFWNHRLCRFKEDKSAVAMILRTKVEQLVEILSFPWR
jgi:hypothetical protein